MTDDVPSLDAPPANVAPPPAGRSPLHWLLEGLFIVVSVVLGFTVKPAMTASWRAAC